MPHGPRLLWRSALCGLALLLAGHGAAARELADMNGRRVEAPDRIARVLGAAPPLSALLMVLAPETMVGLNLPVRPGDERYLPDAVTRLPVVGSTLGHGAELSSETILALRPDLALAWGGAIGQGTAERAEAQFARVGVPVAFVKLDTLADWPAALRFAGALLGRRERAEVLAAAIEQALRRVEAAVGAIPAAQRLRVYYAEGRDGLATECASSFHVEPIVLAGARNLYECTQSSLMGMEKVDPEQLLAWNPDVIVAQDAAFFERLGEMPWRQLKAVRDGRVLYVPRTPLNWLDRPPSFMRALGVQWLANALYPERLKLDIAATARDFYRLFYGRAPDDAELAAWLRAPAPAAPPADDGGHHHRHAQ